jgi:hypothetical protein
LGLCILLTYSIGAPAGVKTEKNKFGYSKTQRANIKFKNSQSTPSITDKSAPFSSRSNDSQPGHKNERSDLRSFRVDKRKHISDDEQSEISDNSPQPDTQQDIQFPPAPGINEQVLPDNTDTMNVHSVSLPSSPQPSYIRSIDGEYNAWNQKEMSLQLRKQTYARLYH